MTVKKQNRLPLPNGTPLVYHLFYKTSIFQNFKFYLYARQISYSQKAHLNMFINLILDYVLNILLSPVFFFLVENKCQLLQLSNNSTQAVYQLFKHMSQ